MFGAFLLGTLLSALCFNLPVPNAAAETCAVALPVASAACFMASAKRLGIAAPELTLANAAPVESSLHDERARKHGAQRGAGKWVTWPFLLAVGGCSLLSSLFSGMVLNPYFLQSDTISHCFYAISIAALLVLLTGALLHQNPPAQAFSLVPVAILLTGLLLLSTGMLGSVIVPIGLILAAKTTCLALYWIALVSLARKSALPTAAVCAFGLLLFDGTLGRGAGMVASSHLSLSFPDIALIASVCVGALALTYALATIAPTPSAGAQNGADTDVKARQAADAAHAQATESQLAETEELTHMEKRIAARIQKGLTYGKIAETCGISERTVKFHAKNIYRKSGVANRRDYERMMAGDAQPTAPNGTDANDQ